MSDTSDASSTTATFKRQEGRTGDAGREAGYAGTWHQSLFATIERWRWLHTLDDDLSAVLRPLRDRHRNSSAIELLHGGRWTGHALHPALSDLPIGFWSGAVLLDTIGYDGASDRPLGPAGTLSAAGMVAALATAATGVNDWTVSDGAARRIGLLHGVMNTAGVTLQGCSLGARLLGRRGTARMLNAASMAVTAAAAYVGGHLVQGRAVMVNRVASSTGPSRWTRVLADDDLPTGVPTGVDVEGRRVLLYRLDGVVHALDNTCSHAGGLLSRGEVAEKAVTCPLHGSQFDLRDGRILRGPAHHPQPVLPVRVREGWIEVRGSQPRSRRGKA